MRSSGLACLLVMATLSAPALGADQPASPSSAGNGSKTDLETAKGLFNQGQVHYSLGEYDEAIKQFRAAYQLSLAPGLLFNIAQAYRLKGDCRQALEVYKHFLRLAPDAPTRVEAEGQVVSLEQQCGTADAAPAPAPRAPAPRPPERAAPILVDVRPTLTQKTEPPVASRWSTRDKVAAGLLGAGVALGVAAGAVYLWNDARYDRWRTADRQLMAPPISSSADWADRQRKNDELWQSIQRADTIDKVLAGTSVACILGSAVLGVVLNRSQPFAAHPGGLALTWRWP